MTYEEAMIRAKRLRERLLQAIVSGKVNGENNDAWLDIVADALYSASLPNELRCPRPINTATDHSMKWCKENGHCGCVEIATRLLQGETFDEREGE